MGIREFLQEVDQDVQAIVRSSFEIEITDTNYVPHVDDAALTHDDTDGGVKRCKRIATCVLYIDIRKSSEISASHKPETLARLYSAFIRAMLKCAGYYGGHVRNIVGDRVMVVFDREQCFYSAVKTAILMNTVAGHIVPKSFKGSDFKCGIGIDYGEMLVVKTGIVRRGDNNAVSKSLVWLGRPANVASKLTDKANKATTKLSKQVSVGLHYPAINEWVWREESVDKFFSRLKSNVDGTLAYEEQYFSACFLGERIDHESAPAILMTKAVFDGFKREAPDEESIKRGWWRKIAVTVSGYSGEVYGSGTYFTAVEGMST